MFMDAVSTKQQKNERIRIHTTHGKKIQSTSFIVQNTTGIKIVDLLDMLVFDG